MSAKSVSTEEDDYSSDGGVTNEGLALGEHSTDAESEDSGEEDGPDDAVDMKRHLELLERQPGLHELNDITTTPIFTEAVRRHAKGLGSGSRNPFPQYGLLAGDAGEGPPAEDPRIFYNVAAPSSAFICGSQGSGKSHTLSCLLENCLLQSPANHLPRPLTGIVFHYDTFISDASGSPCEAAWLSSNPNVSVRVLCAPTNIRTIKGVYKRFRNVRVEELRLSQQDLNTKRMLDLMAVSSTTTMPLYLHVANRILREMRIHQQQTGLGFDYSVFKTMLLDNEPLTKEQLAPLKQRLDTLESFMVEQHAKAYDLRAKGLSKKQLEKTLLQAKGTNWVPASGQLTIVDLSCPCVTADMACSLFNICLSLFLEQNAEEVGRVVALDEAHKYMNNSADCQTLTEALLATIRLQRHLGARILISTQEPTVSPKLLDLCSITIVHRFTSPDWLNALRKHLAGVSSASRLLEKADRLRRGERDSQGGGSELGADVDGLTGLVLDSDDTALELFSKIVSLKTGEALLFAPSAIIGVHRLKTGQAKGGGPDAGSVGVKRLAHGVLRVRIRNRVTMDGGRSIMAA
ncbi:hypothetical protein GQ53DRAFT_641468 [Thozetella sp. PMI_491]|nr:hypothetical protein GQ53DRAFT_641468 [Thozetella sp. PMI_491]